METTVAEIWRDITDYEGRYQVSSNGHVKSLKRKVQCGKRIITINEKILKPAHDGYGHTFVGLYKDGVNKLIKVHKLVALAFLPPCPGEYGVLAGQYVIDHINEIKDDNRAENLQWLLSTENTSKGNRIQKKSSLKGVRHGRSKLTEKQVLEIRKDTRTLQVIGDEYGISIASVSRIRNNKLWKHLD
jgi:hypothetical protein